MKFLILDESHKQESSKGKYFLICGLLIDEIYLLELNKEIESYKASVGFVNLRDFRRSQMPYLKKLDQTRSIFLILNKHNVRVMTAILGETAMSSAPELKKAYMDALYFLIERFALQIRPDKGIIFFDRIGGNVQNYIEEQFFNLVQSEELIMYGNKLGDFKDFIFPSISFINDKFNAILQVSDLISTSFNNAISNSLKTDGYINISKLSVLSPFLEIYWPLVVKSPTNKHDGWGIKLWN